MLRNTPVSIPTIPANLVIVNLLFMNMKRLKNNYSYLIDLSASAMQFFAT